MTSRANLVVVMCVIDNFGFSITAADFAGVVRCCLSIDDIESTVQVFHYHPCTFLLAEWRSSY